MSELTLTSDQFKQLSTADLPLVVRSPNGEVIGVLSRTPIDTSSLKGAFTPEEIAEGERRMRESPRKSMAEVRQHLAALQQQFGQ